MSHFFELRRLSWYALAALAYVGAVAFVLRAIHVANPRADEESRIRLNEENQS